MELLNPYISFAGGQTFYVATDGNNSNPGTEAEPWQTLGFAVGELVAGDTLIVAGGTYYEAVSVTASGTALQPITIIAADGETPIIDGSLSAYRTAGNSAWENVSGNLWRTVATLASPGDFGYTGRIDEAGTLYMLTAYNDNAVGTGLESLEAADDLYDPDNPYYMGPGQSWQADGHIYIRLDPNSSAAQWGTVTPFAFGDVDPRTHAIYLTPNNNGVDISGDWVIVEGINVNHHWTGFTGTGTDVTIRNLTMKPSRFGARVSADRWTFDNVTLQFDRSPWIARSDVKAGAEPAKDTRTGGISWEGGVDQVFTGGSIVGPFDGMLAVDNNDGLTVTNTTFDGCMDDGCQMGSAAINVEFGHCTFVNGAGISHDGSGTDAADTADSVYIHHNIFDNQTPVFWARKPIVGVDPSENGDGGYLSPAPIGNHAVPDFDDPWKLYNNTFVAVISPGIQGVNHYMYHGTSAGDGHHEAYNNLIQITSTDARVYRNANAFTGLEAYDYNIYSRVTPTSQFALDSVDENGDPQATTADFATWQAQMGTFDVHSTELVDDPVTLNGSYEPAISGPCDGTGVDLSATGWPGTTPGTTYIGAKAPV